MKTILISRRIMFLLALVGLFVSTYLFVTYTSGGPIVCGTTHGCDVVRVSQWATMFGLPTPLFGMLFYVGVAALLIFRAMMPTTQSVLAYRLTRLAVVVGVLESAYLTYIQAFVIQAFCTWCLASAVTALLLCIVAFWDRSTSVDATESTKELRFQCIALLIAIIVGAVTIVSLTRPRENTEPSVILPVVQGEGGEDRAKSLLYREGTTFEGPSDAPVTLVEFIDFECPACASFRPELAQIREEMRDRIRFAYRYFPLPVHRHSKEAAIAAVCAEQQGALFTYADTLLQEQQALERDDLVRYAAELRLNMDVFVPCLDSETARLRVEQDMRDGETLGITQTPTVFVNTAMIDGLPNAEQLKEIITNETTL